jgi:2-dehydropantoate 2-reductase
VRWAVTVEEPHATGTPPWTVDLLATLGPTPLPIQTPVPIRAPAPVPVPVPTAASLRLDYLLITTKAYDARAAVAAAAAAQWVRRGHTVLVPWTNGLGVAEALATDHPAQPLLAATTTHGATRLSSARVAHTGRGSVWLGPLASATATNARALEALPPLVHALAAAGWDPIAEPVGMGVRLWAKACVSCCLNGPAAVLACPNGALQDAMALHAVVSEEVAAVMAAEGMAHVAAADLARAAQLVRAQPPSTHPPSRPACPCVCVFATAPFSLSLSLSLCVCMAPPLHVPVSLCRCVTTPPACPSVWHWRRC